MVRKSIIGLVLGLCLLAAGAQAQPDPEAAFLGRGMRLIDSTMNTINIRIQRFNEEMNQVNQLRPFDSVSLTPEKLRSNRQGIKDFLEYLEVYHSINAKMIRQIDDSLKAIRADAPRTHKRTFMQEFQEAFHKDQEAFDKYLSALAVLWKKIDEVLLFLTEAKIELHGNRIQFTNTDTKEYDKYQKMMVEVNKLNVKVSTAATVSMKASAEANEAMQEAYNQKLK